MPPLQQVGTNVGNVYRGQEGVGLAHVFGRAPIMEAIAAGDQAKQAATQKAALDKMSEAPENVWHYYSSGVQKAYDEWFQNGAEMMSRGINDPWTSQDPKAIDWRINGSTIKKAAANIKQAESLYNNAIKDIGVRGDEYTEEYVQSVKDFPLTHSLQDMATGGFNFPEARFKNPGKLYTKYYQGMNETITKELGENVFPDDAEIRNRTTLFFSADENESEARAAKQMYDSLNERNRKEMDALAGELGYGEDNGWMALAHKNLKDTFGLQPLDLNEELQKSAGRMPLDLNRWSTEDFSSVTTAGYTRELKRMEPVYDEAKNFWIRNDSYLMHRPTMEGLGIPMSLTKEERREMAEDIYARNIVDRAKKEREYRLSRGGSGRATDEEIQASFDLWRQTLESEDLSAANEAAGFTRGITGPITGIGRISGANIIPGSDVIDPEIFANIAQVEADLGTSLDYPMGIDRAIKLTFENPGEAVSFKEKYLKEAIDQAQGDGAQDMAGIPPALQEQMRQAQGQVDQGEVQRLSRQLLNMYERASQGNTVYIPLTKENEQVLKLIHQKAVEEHKGLFEPVNTQSVNPMGMPSAPTTGAQPGGDYLNEFDSEF